MLKSFTHTRAACYLGYVTQAAVNNFAPLLLLIFSDTFGLSLAQLTALVTINFGVQLTVDLVFSKLADKIGYRASLAAAHFLAAAGLAGYAALPRLLPPFLGLALSGVLCAVGGGIVEVLISPTIEACPAQNKASQMSLLHSFYCWGSAGVILLSTAFLALFGRSLWWVLALVWAALPLCNAVYFLFVPIARLTAEGEGFTFGQLFRCGKFRLFFALIALAGAAELSMSQWASAFAESGLGVSKAAGDLAGPCLFAVLMGIARVLYARFGRRLRLCLILSGTGCIACYLVTWLVPIPALALAGCALCGFTVGMLWPGIFSMAAEELPRGGTAMFALLALAGDAGCMLGPTLVGACAGAFGDDIGTGLAFALVFPVLLVLLLLLSARKKKTEK